MTNQCDRKIFLSVIDGGLLKPRQKNTESLKKTFSTPEMSYRENLHKLAKSYDNFLKIPISL